MRIDCGFRSLKDFRGDLLQPLPRRARIVLIENRRGHFRMSPFCVWLIAIGLAAHYAFLPLCHQYIKRWCARGDPVPHYDFEIIEDLFSFDNELAIFMRAYFDERGKHEAATVISIFALLMSADTCKELQRRWHREASKPPVIPLPFHMSDCVCESLLSKTDLSI